MQEKYFIYGNNIINSIYSCLIVRQQHSIHILSLQRPLPSFVILFEKGSSITYESPMILGSSMVHRKSTASNLWCLPIILKILLAKVVFFRFCMVV